jgi:hypothetical protein
MDIDQLAALMFTAAEMTARDSDKTITEGPTSVEETREMLAESPDVLMFFSNFAELCREV